MTSSKAIAVTVLLVLLALLLQGCEATAYDQSTSLDQSRTVRRAQMHQPPAPHAAPPVAPN